MKQYTSRPVIWSPFVAASMTEAMVGNENTWILSGIVNCAHDLETLNCSRFTGHQQLLLLPCTHELRLSIAVLQRLLVSFRTENGHYLRGSASSVHNWGFSNYALHRKLVYCLIIAYLQTIIAPSPDLEIMQCLQGPRCERQLIGTMRE